jgi:hypothetical protein
MHFSRSRYLGKQFCDIVVGEKEHAALSILVLAGTRCDPISSLRTGILKIGTLKDLS